LSNIRDISDRYKERTYKIDNCAGCGNEIKNGEEYHQVVLPSSDNDIEVTHIALCNECYKESKKHGIF